MIDSEFDMREVERGFDELVRQGTRPGDLFRELKPDLRADQVDHKKRQLGPEGRWDPLDPDTRARRPKRRRVLGRLPGAVAYKASEDALTATSRVAWSNVHQEGGTVGNNARIPARPFLWFSERFMELVRESAEQFMARIWGRK